jgi:hypothetical protein
MSERKKTALKRKKITLEDKISILDRLNKGEGSSAVAKSLNLNEATVRTIKKSEDKIKQRVAAGNPVSAKKACYTHLSDANTTSEDADDDNQNNEDLNKASSSSSNSKALREHLDMLAICADFFREIDPSPDLGQKFHRDYTQLIKRYEELYKELINNQKQPLITQFLKKC